MPIGAIVTAISNVVGTAMRSKHEQSLNKQTIQAQKDQAEYAYSKDLEQWERSNAYNAPTEQMARLRDAGLNPAMIYGSGGAKTTAATSPQYQSVNPKINYSPPFDPTAMIGLYQNFRRQNAEIDLIKQNARKARSEADSAQQFYAGRASSSVSGALSKSLDQHIREWRPSHDDPKTGKQWVSKTRAFQKSSLGLTQQQSLIDQMDARTALTDKQTEYYLWNTFGNLAAGAANKIFRRFSTKTLPKTLPKGARYMPQGAKRRYTPPAAPKGHPEYGNALWNR